MQHALSTRAKGRAQPLFSGLPQQRRGLAGFAVGDQVMALGQVSPQRVGRIIAVLPRFYELVVRFDTPPRINVFTPLTCRKA